MTQEMRNQLSWVFGWVALPIAINLVVLGAGIWLPALGVVLGIIWGLFLVGGAGLEWGLGHPNKAIFSLANFSLLMSISLYLKLKLTYGLLGSILLLGVYFLFINFLEWSRKNKSG